MIFFYIGSKSNFFLGGGAGGVERGSGVAWEGILFGGEGGGVGGDATVSEFFLGVKWVGGGGLESVNFFIL